jgi:hypothetical protein
VSFDIRDVIEGSGLARKQRLFAYLFHQLQARAYSMGYEVVMGEVWRGPAQVEAYARSGKGHRSTLHALCLAGHIWLFRDDVFLVDTDDYYSLGAWWKAQHPLCRWGGDFSRPDGVHFSVTHGGVA